MLDLRLIFANITRWKILSAITVLTVVVAFFFFLLLLSLDRVFNAGVSLDKAKRLVVANEVAIMQPLPLAYEQRIQDVDGVSAVSRNVFFGAFYQEPTQGLMAIATEPRGFLELIPELSFANEAEKERWFNDPATVAVGRDMAEKYDWKVGDLVPLYSFLYQRDDGGSNWTFRIAAIYDTEAEGSNTNSMLLHYSYLDHERIHGKQTVGWYNVRIKDPRDAERIAGEIDGLFSNSHYETRTATEELFAQALMRQVGDFGLIVRMAMIAVFFTLALVTANTMMHSVNERVNEFATLKALGSSDGRIFWSVIAEGIAVIALGAVLGVALTYVVIPMIADWSVVLESIRFEWQDLWWVAAAVVLTGVVTSLAPALQAWRVNTGNDLGRAA